MQLTKERIAEGNMLLSAGVLLSGLTYKPVNHMMKISGIQFLGKAAFYEIQKRYLFPAINHVYSQQKDVNRTGAQSKNVHLIGDGRFDSPGCSAKYSTYTLMTLKLTRY